MFLKVQHLVTAHLCRACCTWNTSNPAVAPTDRIAASTRINSSAGAINHCRLPERECTVYKPRVLLWSRLPQTTTTYSSQNCSSDSSGSVDTRFTRIPVYYVQRSCVFVHTCTTIPSSSLTLMLQACSISLRAFSAALYRLGSWTLKNLRAPSKSACNRSSLDVWKETRRSGRRENSKG